MVNYPTTEYMYFHTRILSMIYILPPPYTSSDTHNSSIPLPYIHQPWDIYFTFYHFRVCLIQSFDCALHDGVVILLPIVMCVLKAPCHRYLTTAIHLGFTVNNLLLFKFESLYKQMNANFLPMDMIIFAISINFCFSKVVNLPRG